MIVEKTQIPKTLIIFLDIESLRTGQELENIYEEFYDLVKSAGATIVGESSSKQRAPSISHFINKGKLDEIHTLVETTCAELVIVNHQLSASQARNLELKLKVRVIDKTELILSANLNAIRFLSCSGHSSQLFLSIKKTLLVFFPNTLFSLTSFAIIKSIFLEINFSFA